MGMHHCTEFRSPVMSIWAFRVRVKIRIRNISRNRNTSVCVCVVRRLTRQLEDLVEGVTVVKCSGNHTLFPEAFSLELVHLPARVHAVFTADHPVTGGGGDDHADPPHKTQEKTTQLQARARHRHTVTRQREMYRLNFLF